MVFRYDERFRATPLERRLGEFNRSPVFDWGRGHTDGCCQLAYAVIRDATGDQHVAHYCYHALADILGHRDRFFVLAQDVRDWAVAECVENLYSQSLRADWKARRP